MAKSSTIPRPTEAAALGSVRPRRVHAFDLYEGLARTVRHLIAQTAAGGRLGEA